LGRKVRVEGLRGTNSPLEGAQRFGAVVALKSPPQADAARVQGLGIGEVT